MKGERKVYLVEEAEKYNTNVSFVKFLAAILVIIAHAFPLTGGMDCMDIIGIITYGELNFGAISVGFFFLIGGFYVAKSMMRLKRGKPYFIARIVKIFPGLIMVVVSSLIFGSFFSTYSWKEYWHSSESWSYLWNCFLILHHDLPGVFQNNVYTSTVNGSLWSLPVEWVGYIGCYIFYKIKLLSNYFWVSLPFVLVLLIIGYPYLIASIALRRAFRACLLFYIGMGFYVYREKIVLTKKKNLFFWILFIMFILFKQSNLAMVVAFPYLIMHLLFFIRPCTKNLAKLGNLSYGMYLCAFPIQQVMAMFFKSPYLNILLSVPISIIIGWIIYQCTEKPLKFIKIG